jgi:chromosome segregation ATPase
MKPNPLVAVLVVACITLGLVLFFSHRHSEEYRSTSVAQIQQLSNRVNQVNAKLDEQMVVNQTLETNRAQLKSALEVTSNSLNQTAATLAKSQAEAKAQSEAAAAEIAKRDAKISELQGENDDMTKKMGDLTNALGSLEKQISETKRKLAASEGDREILMKELKRLQAEKAELERQFHDLALVREQVRKLKDELAIAKRLEWIRDGVYGALAQKGAERLASQQSTASNAPPALNVELRQNGSVKVTPGTNAPAPASSTNAPAGK